MEDHQVVAAVLRRADQVLLCHRSPWRRWYPDVWDFPGGHVRPGERPEDALRREVAEELGAELEDLDGGPVLHRIDPQAGVNLAVWASRRWRGTVTNLQPEEHDAIRWFEKGQLDGLRFADPSYLSAPAPAECVSWKGVTVPRCRGAFRWVQFVNDGVPALEVRELEQPHLAGLSFRSVKNRRRSAGWLATAKPMSNGDLTDAELHLAPASAFSRRGWRGR